MGRIRTPWDRVAEVDPTRAASYSLPNEMNAPAETYIDPVAPALPEGNRTGPKTQFKAVIQRDGSVAIPANMISPVMGVMMGWWRDNFKEEPSAPPAPSSLAVPLHDDAVVDQRCAPVPRDLYLRLARQGRFKSKKIGKRICARWADVRAAFAHHNEIPDPPNNTDGATEPDDGLDDLRRRVGLVPKER